MSHRDQPDPYEAPAAITKLLADLADTAAVRQTWHTGETFVQCLVCGDWDGHAETCPMPAIERWLAQA